MKDLQLLTWLTQLGLGTAVPLAGFILLAIWLQNRFDLGIWVLFVGIGAPICTDSTKKSAYGINIKF